LLSFYGVRKASDNIGHDAHLGGAIIGLLIAAALNPSSVTNNPTVFLVVLIPAILLLVYLWVNPLFLPVTSFFGAKSKTRADRLPKYKQENLQLDAILEKIASKGMDSLSREEKAFLRDASGKYQRRAESKKPESGLAI